MSGLSRFILTTATAAAVASSGVSAADQACDAATATPEWNSYFPPIGSDMKTWFAENVPEIPSKPEMTSEEQKYVSWTAAEFIAQRRAGAVTCEAYARALTDRAKHYRTMNQFMYWDNDPEWTDRVVAAAVALDAKADAEGVESLAPLYCLPLPAKGTMATKDFKSSAGVGILHNFNALRDCAMVERVQEANGVVFGKTNVPEFAGSLVTCNYGAFFGTDPMAFVCTCVVIVGVPDVRGLSVCPQQTDAPSTRTIPSFRQADRLEALAQQYRPIWRQLRLQKTLAVSLTFWRIAFPNRDVPLIAVLSQRCVCAAGSTRAPAFQNGNFGYDPTRGMTRR